MRSLLCSKYLFSDNVFVCLYRFKQPQRNINDEFLMNYFITHKKIPAMLEKEIIDNERIPQILEPSETTCPSCDSNIDSCCTAISSKATVYESGKLYKGGMDLVNFIFMSRLAVHLHNQEVNSKYLKKLKRRFDEVMFNDCGIAIPRMKGFY